MALDPGRGLEIPRPAKGNPPEELAPEHSIEAMREKSILLLFPALTLSSVLLACGGDDDGHENGEPPVSGATPLTDIDNDQEAQVVCERLAETITAEESEALRTGACALQGWVEAQTGGDCDQVQAACLAASEPAEDPATCTAEDIPDCSLTVDQYVECLDAGVGVIGSITCTSTSLQVAAFATLPAHCQTGIQACSGSMP